MYTTEPCDGSNIFAIKQAKVQTVAAIRLDLFICNELFIQLLPMAAVRLFVCITKYVTNNYYNCDATAQHNDAYKRHFSRC